jgi:hypothetical protein
MLVRRTELYRRGHKNMAKQAKFYIEQKSIAKELLSIFEEEKDFRKINTKSQIQINF